jgi:hypothetical protein
MNATAPKANIKRTRTLTFFALAGVTAVSLAASTAMLNLLADRFAARVDVTATGEQQLAPRTTQLLSQLAGSTQLIVAADFRTIDPRARQYLTDVTDELSARSREFSSTLIDTGSTRGVADFKGTIASLVQRDKAILDAHVVAIETGSQAATGVSQRLSQNIEPEFAKLAQAGFATPTLRTYANQAAAVVRLRASDLADVSARVKQNLTPDDLGLPKLDEAQRALLERMDQAASDLSALARDVRRLSQDASTPSQATQQLSAIASQLDTTRDATLAQLGKLRELKRPDLLRVAAALRTGAAALLVGPPGTDGASSLVALDMGQLLPSGAWLDATEASRGDQRRRVEELVAAALASVLAPSKPIVVFTHAELRAFMDEAPVIDAMRERLGLRGVDFVEWSVVTQDAPAIAEVDPTLARPLVYVVISPDSAARSETGAMSGTQRAAKLAQTITALREKQGNMLVCLLPSMLPGFGEKDPIAVAIESFGINARTGTPLLTRITTPQFTYVENERVVQTTDASEHVIASAVRGLPTYMTWCVPVELATDSRGWRGSPVLTTPADTQTWGESQWLRVYQTPREQVPLIPDQPKFDEGRDVKGGTGAWTLAVATEKDSQRAVIVGSNSWITDKYSQQMGTVEGRQTLLFPGNVELFEASVLWLAGQDTMIAQSPAARSVAMVRAIESPSLTRLRWSIVLGLPGLVLLVGVIYGMTRK